ncbi:deoxyribonuclease IV [Ammoniphilus sp. CFH 90114]|uniref:deoxyribonuclease IV n=1 Tax=Ammoniphilus sp. CFH 90114 TaxID=2493665 RepID=UPI00100DE1C3|nr:deoxyribonuclease IV [Ammoniphilus sp. CFH 90114]RXT07841.1 deoxyribonuclease IV [Ammoniphilus sp. CFH 90114]
MKLGSHVSIRNGYIGAAQHAVKIGAQSFQYFPKNPRSLTVKAFDTKDAARCAVFCRENGIESIAHAPYPVNLSEEEPDLREVLKASLANDMEIAEACGSIGLVVHFGKYKGADALEGYKLMIDMLNSVLRDWKGQLLLLIENNAGQGVRMGTTLEELVQVRKLTDYPEKIGYCLDTCHAYASGLWSGSNWDEIVSQGEALDYFSHLKAVHLNDSAYGYASFRDRHANVGRGHIGREAMIEFLRSHVIQELPLILETPNMDNYTHQDEIQFIRQELLH